jgi:uncharacterized ubiquitin-like protein YukD
LVTIFLTGAQIEREASANIPVGVSEVVFSGLSNDINQQSIQVKGEGDFTILSVNKQSNFLSEQLKSDEIKGLKEKIKALDVVLANLNDEGEILKIQEEILKKNQEASSTASDLDINKLKILLDYQKNKLSLIKNDLNDLQTKREKEVDKLNDFRKQLNQLIGKSAKNTSDIVVKVKSKSALKANFKFSYLVNNANWFPTYDIRAKDVNEPIQIVYKANVSQQSGEDWTKVKLNLSSGNPSEDTNLPPLNPYILGYNWNTNNNVAIITKVSGRVVDAKDKSGLPGVNIVVKGTSIATATDVNGNYQIAIPQNSRMLVYSYIGYQSQEIGVYNEQMNVSLNPDYNKLEEVVVVGFGTEKLQGRLAGVQLSSSPTIKIRGISSVPVEVNSQQAQTSLLFDIKEIYTVPSDGKLTTVEIGNYDMPATFLYNAIPKLSKNVNLKAEIIDFADLNLLSGEANIFFDGTFLGSSLIDLQQAKDTLSISLGNDKNVIITREKQKEFKEKQFLGSSEKVTRDFLITIKNRKNKAIDLIVFDQLPISTIENITVEKLEISGAELDEKTGKLTWKLKLQPNEEKKLSLKYQVKYPKNGKLNLE